jgi:ADP-heptose:LPS heptosyltransferase
MSNTLFVNLKRIGDIFSSAHLAHSMKKKDEGNNISILIFKEFESNLKSLNLFDKIYTINRQDILTLKGNDLFSDSLSLNLFTDALRPLKKIKFDTIVNYSNDEISTNIISFLNFKKESKVVGIQYDKKRNILFNSDWSIVFNDILTTFSLSPIHFIDCFHKMSNISPRLNEKIIISNKKYDELAKNNFNQIKKMKFKEPDLVKVIGIQLKTSDKKKDIPKNTVIALLKQILNAENILPVLLISPSLSEKDYANDINKIFKNALISIESDFLALPSVLNNLDLLITPDTSVKHIADLNNTPLLEVINGPAPFLKQGTYNRGNTVLTHKNNLINKPFKLDNIGPSHQDIFTSCLYQLGLISKEAPLDLTPEIILLKCDKDLLGTKYVLISSSTDSDLQKDLISIYMSRYYLQSIFSEKNIEIDSNIFSKFKIETITDWIKYQKEQTAQLSKDLLKTLKTLINIQKNINDGIDFANSLDKLFQFCSSRYLASIPSLLFRTKIENLVDVSFDNNMKSVEGLLYEFKDNIQVLLNRMDELGKLIGKTPKKPVKINKRPLFIEMS